MNRTIITLIGSARELSARQMLLALNMNRVQNAISSTNIQEILASAQSRENDVLIYKVPEYYSIARQTTANNHKQLITKYTPYKSVIIYTYENFRPMPNDGRLLEEYCQKRGIDACWNPFAPVEKNDQMLIDLLGLDKL
jgi:hypothetical protein